MNTKRNKICLFFDGGEFLFRRKFNLTSDIFDAIAKKQYKVEESPCHGWGQDYEGDKVKSYSFGGSVSVVLPKCYESIEDYLGINK